MVNSLGCRAASTYRVGILVLAERARADPFIRDQLVELHTAGVEGVAPTGARLIRCGQRFPDTRVLLRFEETSQ